MIDWFFIILIGLIIYVSSKSIGVAIFFHSEYEFFRQDRIGRGLSATKFDFLFKFWSSLDPDFAFRVRYRPWFFLRGIGVVLTIFMSFWIVIGWVSEH